MVLALAAGLFGCKLAAGLGEGDDQQQPVEWSPALQMTLQGKQTGPAERDSGTISETPDVQALIVQSTPDPRPTYAPARLGAQSVPGSQPASETPALDTMAGSPTPTPIPTATLIITETLESTATALPAQESTATPDLLGTTTVGSPTATFSPGSMTTTPTLTTTLTLTPETENGYPGAPTETANGYP